MRVVCAFKIEAGYALEQRNSTKESVLLDLLRLVIQHEVFITRAYLLPLSLKAFFFLIFYATK